MVDDFRNTKYCPRLEKLLEKKNNIEEEVKKDYKKATDMHKYISDNKLRYKNLFIEAYNRKCAYCGVPLGIINWKQFEIDHFIPKGSTRFKSKTQAGNIKNLVLSCYDCNRAKGDFELDDENRHKIDPDNPDFCKSFFRDNDYYIKISEEFKDDKSVNSFYYKIGFDSQTHRLDYLLINMCGLRDSLKDKPLAYIQLNEAIELIKNKRR